MALGHMASLTEPTTWLESARRPEYWLLNMAIGQQSVSDEPHSPSCNIRMATRGNHRRSRPVERLSHVHMGWRLGLATSTSNRVYQSQERQLAPDGGVRREAYPNARIRPA